MKLPRLLAVGFLILGTSFFFMPTAEAVPPELMARDVTIICANPAGETNTALTGWDADNSYFNGRGEIPRLFCEGGFLGQWTTYISDNYTGVGRYYNGIAPTPTASPSPEPTPSPSPTSTETVTVQDTVTVVVDSPTVVVLLVETVTAPSESSTLTIPVETPTELIIPSDTPTVLDTSTVVVEPIIPEAPIVAPVVPPTPPVVQPEPTPQPQPQPEPQPQPQPEVQPEPAPVAPEPIEDEPPVPVPVEEEPPPVEPEPVAEPEPLPVEELAPEPQPEPPLEEEPAPEPEPEPEPVPEPAPEPVIDIAPEPPVEEPEPPVVATEDSTPEEREVIAEALVEAAQGEAVTAEAIADAGLTYADLPADTPVEVREDENGNEVVITAEVAAALVVLESPAALIEAIFTDPAQALLAIASIGADMSDEEREESEKIIVASVIAGQAAVNAASMAGTAAAYRRKP